MAELVPRRAGMISALLQSCPHGAETEAARGALTARCEAVTAELGGWCRSAEG